MLRAVVNVAALSLSLLWAHVLLRLLGAPGPECALNSENAPVGTSSSVPKSVCQDWHSRCSGPNLRAVLAKMFFASSLTHDLFQHFE